MAKVLIDWVERYPELSLFFEEDEAGRATEYKHQQREQAGIEVPDDVAERWRATRDAWVALDDEVRRLTGRDPGIGA